MLGRSHHGGRPTGHAQCSGQASTPRLTLLSLQRPVPSVPGPFKSIRLVAKQQCGPRCSCTAEALPRASLAGSRWLALNKGLPPAGGGQLRGRVDRAHQTAPALPGMSVEGTSRAPLARPSLPPDSPSKRKENQVPAAGFFFPFENPRLELASVWKEKKQGVGKGLWTEKWGQAYPFTHQLQDWDWGGEKCHLQWRL